MTVPDRFPANACALEPEQGPCNNYTVRWFFNATSGRCRRFWFGGCEGNDNSFATRDECDAFCSINDVIDVVDILEGFYFDFSDFL